MPNQTPNYNLTKPLQTENYNVDVFNNNADIIDSKIKENNDKILLNSNDIINLKNMNEYAEYTINAAATIPNDTSYDLILNSVIKSDNGNTELIGGNIKINKSGNYEIIFSSIFQASSTGVRKNSIKKNSSIVKETSISPNSGDTVSQIITLLNLSQNDLISASVYQNSGSSLNCANDSRYLYFQIRRVG